MGSTGSLARCFEQEPGPSFCLVDEILQEARGSDVAVLAAEVVRFPQSRGQVLVVVTQFREHIERRDKIGIVVLDALQTADMADRAHRHSADLTDTLGNDVGGGEYLVGLFVQEKMVVAKMRARDVPVEVL